MGYFLVPGYRFSSFLSIISCFYNPVYQVIKILYTHFMDFVLFNLNKSAFLGHWVTFLLTAS